MVNLSIFFNNSRLSFPGLSKSNVPKPFHFILDNVFPHISFKALLHILRGDGLIEAEAGVLLGKLKASIVTQYHKVPPMFCIGQDICSKEYCFMGPKEAKANVQVFNVD